MKERKTQLSIDTTNTSEHPINNNTLTTTTAFCGVIIAMVLRQKLSE